jgi:hypothetical protein
MDFDPEHHFKAVGQLRHRFWGRYSARIALKFESQELADLAFLLLQEALPKDMKPVVNAGGGLWKPGAYRDQKMPVVCLEVDSDDLEAVKALLQSLGADPDKIDSMATSIDFGERFEIWLPKRSELATENPCPTLD